MSKIILTEEQGNRLNSAGLRNSGTLPSWYAHVLNEAITMGLVRPASDDIAARVNEVIELVAKHLAIVEKLTEASQKMSSNVAALTGVVGTIVDRLKAVEAKANGKQWDKAPDTYEEEAARGIAAAHNTPDPHAAAKERAKLWGVELVTLKDGTCLFMTEKHYLSNPNPSWYPHVFSFRSPHYSGGQENPSKAWSNFPTEPPPGWEERQSKAIPPKLPEPRTEADRLGEVAWRASGNNEPMVWNQQHPKIQECYINEALAVRKAVLESQLEPNREEVEAAIVCWRESTSTVSSMDQILKAAARVRLEKAEGEQ